MLQIVEEYNPDLVLLDLHMPPPDGFAILRSLAPRLTGAGYLPVLVLTGDGSSESKRGALSTGARDFLFKPFDGTEVLLRIRNLLETRFLYQKILSGGQSELMIVAERIALNHHERWDGQGYPNNIAGSAIPVEARIVAVAPPDVRYPGSRDSRQPVRP